MDFTVSEQYKLLRTNLSFTLPEDVKCPIIGVTSSMRGEGKSTTAVNLSYALAQSGKKVLLIDGDLRLPSVAKKMKLENTKGLSNMLFDYDSQQLEEYKSQYLDNWYIVPAGELPPNPSELLGSRKLGRLLDRLSESFDYIVIDFPPVNIVSDALAASKPEVLYFEGVSRMEGLKSLCIEGTDLLLLEMPVTKWSSYILSETVNLARSGEFRIVIAHFERCIPAQKRGMLDYLLENDLLIQANASYFLERRTKRRAISLLKKNKIHFLGYDSHNMKERAPRLYAAYNLIGKKLGEPD